MRLGFYNESNLETMKRIPNNYVDVVLTSPFYNTNNTVSKNKNLLNNNESGKGYTSYRYDVFVDNMSNDEYNAYILQLFEDFDRILKKNGTIIWNANYGATNAECLFLSIAEILKNSNFTLLDCICWKKKCATPNNVSSNRLTRIWEFVFVFCRKNETSTAHCNKKQVSISKNNQKIYENLFNFIEAPNNDGSCPFNKATFSSEFCEKLLKLYAPNDAVIYDPFMGSGTTAVACRNMNLKFIGSEISENQYKWASDRLRNLRLGGK